MAGLGDPATRPQPAPLETETEMARGAASDAAPAAVWGGVTQGVIFLLGGKETEEEVRSQETQRVPQPSSPTGPLTHGLDGTGQ